MVIYAILMIETNDHDCHIRFSYKECVMHVSNSSVGGVHQLDLL